mgnify:FL=1
MYICPSNTQIRLIMGHKILKSKLKYAVLNKESKTISIYHLQKDVADLFNVSRKTILRNINEYKMYENDKYIVYLITNVPQR